MEKFKYTIISLLSGGMFLLFLFILKINLVVAIALTLLMYIGLSVILSEKQRMHKNREQERIEIIEYTILRNSFNKSRLRINEVGNHIQDLNGQVKVKVIRICDISEKIFDNLKKKPSNIREVKIIFSYYLDTLDKILSLYIELSNEKINNNEVTIRLNKIEKILDDVLVVFEKYLEKSLENKLFNLDVEMKLLQDTMRMEVNI